VLIAPSTAFASGPTRSATTLVSEGFEVGTTPTYSVITLGQPSTARWAPIARAYAGTRGLWCAGSAGLRTNYLVGTFGLAQFELPQLVDYHSSSLSFRYLMPTIGAGEKKTGFQVYWESPGKLGIDPLVFPPLTSTWQSYTTTLSTGSQALARRSGHVVFKFADASDPVGGTQVGQGPTIDEIRVTGWKFGPPRSVVPTVSSGSVSIGWQKPYRSAVEPTVEERDVTYRVWRASGGSSTWTELTTSRIPGTSFSELLPGEGASYRYSVQAWDVGAGTGYGAPVDATVTVPANPPVVSVASPVAGFALSADSPVVISGSAGDVGTGLSSVKVRIRRADGKCWTGVEWTTWDHWLTAGTTNGYASWSLTWTPGVADVASGQVVTVTAKAIDRAGLSTLAPAVSSVGTPPVQDDPAPADLSMSVSATTIAYGASTTITGELASQGAPLSGRTVQLQYYSGGWKPLSEKLTDPAGKAVFSAYPVSKGKTTYRLQFSETGFDTATSASIAVTPRVYLGVPSRASVVYRNTTFTSRATLNPRHTAGSTPVKLLCYRYEGGKWVYRKGFWAKAYNYSSYSRVYAKVKLPYAGKWRMRAYSPADSLHAKSYGSYTGTFLVK
jgi:hypothetical protein